MSDKACQILFMYSKNNTGPNIDLWEIPQFMVPASEKTVLNETKKLCLSDMSKNILYSYQKNLCTSFCLIRFCNLS